MLRDIERYTKQKIEPLKLPTEADVAARREERVKKQLTDTLEEQDLSVYLKLVKELAEETTIDIADIAAAATFLSVGDKQLAVSTGNDMKQFSFSEEGMVRLFIGIGRKHRVSPGDIVGAIANEADIPGKVIGAIDVNDGFTLVDIPAEFVERVLTNMQFSQIRKQNMNIRLASTGEVQTTRDTPPRERNSGRIENKPKRKSKGNDDGKKKGKRKTLAKDSPFANFKKRKKTKKKK
jgi:ATP-dependent RNA helicase DeaD